MGVYAREKLFLQKARKTRGQVVAGVGLDGMAVADEVKAGGNTATMVVWDFLARDSVAGGILAVNDLSRTYKGQKLLPFYRSIEPIAAPIEPHAVCNADDMVWPIWSVFLFSIGKAKELRE